MNTSVHIPEPLAQRLNDYLDKRNNDSSLSRNAAVVEAIRDWLDRQEPVREWSKEILDWCSQPQSEEDIFELAIDEQNWGDFSL